MWFSTIFFFSTFLCTKCDYIVYLRKGEKFQYICLGKKKEFKVYYKHAFRITTTWIIPYDLILPHRITYKRGCILFFFFRFLDSLIIVVYRLLYKSLIYRERDEISKTLLLLSCNKRKLGVWCIYFDFFFFFFIQKRWKLEKFLFFSLLVCIYMSTKYFRFYRFQGDMDNNKTKKT